MEIRTITDGEAEAYRDAMFATFGEDREADPDGASRFRAIVEPGQAWAAFEGSTIVATAATLNFDMFVPGGETLPLAGLSAVTVRPTHRRRGILRELMRLHFEDARTRGQPLSGLWASETAIYSRFGYGLACESDHTTIEHAHTLELPTREVDELEWLDDARAKQVQPAIYARAIAGRPGAFQRSAVWWRERRYLEAPFYRAGASKLRHVLVRRGSEHVGYVAYRQRAGFTDGLPTGKVEIFELQAIDPRAAATLWKFLFSIDLFPTVVWQHAPVDDWLAWAVGDPRRVVRRRQDTMWLRIDDIPRALQARRYEADATLRMQIDGALYELAIEGGRARCSETVRDPELTLSRAALAAIYLGGVRATRLARAGTITGSADALARADRMFASAIAPWCSDGF